MAQLVFGLASYVSPIGARSNVVLVAQSLAGFTAPLVGARVPIRWALPAQRDDSAPR